MENPGDELYLPRRGHRIFCRQWLCGEPGKARANVLVAHGMGEHSGRYGGLAKKLNDAGFNVFAPDLRGHGLSLPPLCQVGDMGHHGWHETLTDLAYLQQWMTQQNDRPAILFGHSMGAMLAQQYAYTHGHHLQALVLSGSPGAMPRLRTLLGGGITRFDSWRLTPSSPSPLIGKALFANNNKKFERDGDGDGGFAWLSRDREQVAAYREDPFCGATLTASGLASMFASQGESVQTRSIQRINKNMAIYLFAGTDDPINNETKGLLELERRYRKAGLNVQLKLYPEGRHEMLNELNRDEVMDDLLAWLTESANV